MSTPFFVTVPDMYDGSAKSRGLGWTYDAESDDASESSSAGAGAGASVAGRQSSAREADAAPSVAGKSSEDGAGPCQTAPLRAGKSAAVVRRVAPSTGKSAATGCELVEGASAVL